MVGDVVMWLGRIVSLLPQLVDLWTAAKTKDPSFELEAQLALTRAIKDAQAREEIGG